MVADPIIIGYTPLVLPGYMLDSFLGKGAFSVVYKATQSNAASSSSNEFFEVCPQLPASFIVHPIIGEGNCFFRAIADQLQYQGVHDASGNLFTVEALNQLTFSVVSEQPRLRALLIEYRLDLPRLHGELDTETISAMAVILKEDIVLYEPEGVKRFLCNYRDRASPLALRILYDGHGHYDSVIPGVEGPIASRKRRRREPEATNVTTPQMVTTEPSAVVVKVFQHNRRAMRNNELKVLKCLGPHRHLPFVVGHYNLPDGISRHWWYSYQCFRPTESAHGSPICA